MNVIDLLLILIVLLGIYAGYVKGFVRGAISLASIVSSLLIAYWSYRYLAALTNKHISGLGVWSLPLAFVFSYFIARLLSLIVCTQLLGNIPGRTQHLQSNKVLGMLPGAIKGLINAAITSILLLVFPLGGELANKTEESRFAMRLYPHVEWAESMLVPVFDEAIRLSISKLAIEPGSDKTTRLNFRVTAPRIREDLEEEMLVLVNEERNKAGLPQLKADAEMRAVARAHSADMFARGYFSHVNPDGKTLVDRAHAAGIRFVTAGENLAWAPTLKMSHVGLMNSAGHRANILRGSYGRVGIGIMDGGRYGLMVTQDFRN